MLRLHQFSNTIVVTLAIVQTLYLAVGGIEVSSVDASSMSQEDSTLRQRLRQAVCVGKGNDGTTTAAVATAA